MRRKRRVDIDRLADAILAGERLPEGQLDADDAAALRAAIELRAARPGADNPSEEFVTDLRRKVAAAQADRKGYLFPVGGGDAKEITGFPEGYIPVGLSSDGKTLLIYNPGDLPAKVEHLNLATGQRQPWKSLMPADSAGVTDLGPILVTPDGQRTMNTYLGACIAF